MSSESSHEEDNIDDIALLPERKKKFKRVRINRRSLYEGEGFGFVGVKPRGMCTRRALIFSSVSAVVLFTVLLVAVFARPSSSSEDEYEVADKRSPKEDGTSEMEEQDDKIIYKTKAGERFSWQEIKLPSNIVPIKYRVHLHPNLTTFKFYGRVEIVVKCIENTRTIHLHTRDLNVHKHRVYTFPKKNQGLRELSKTENSGAESPKLQMFAFELENELQSGEYYIVYMEYDSSLSNGLSGFYKSSYKTKSGETRYLATTHFEPTDARRAFPCFDEPALKANFSVIIAHDPGYSALSNMPIAKTVLENGLVEDHFAESVKMSTYLVAFVVCDFKYKESFTENPKIRVRVWAPADQINEADFAVGAAVKVLTFYQTFFKVPFPLPKMDLIAIPDFSAGAMENWGLITYRLTSLLYDPNESSDSNKQWVAVVVAHELAHQWFGNLVTMKWWNDLWLNEGFASYVEFIGANEVAKDWKMLDQFIVSDLETAMELDQLSNSHPVSVPVHDPAQINEIFDSISYDKGASIIRMLKNFLGDDVFIEGLQHYLKKHAFGNAETDDLWHCFTKASLWNAQRSGSNSNVNVKAVMDTWTLQMGFPLIKLTRHGDRVLATQRHFLVNPKAKPAMESPFDYKWKVPLTFRTDTSSKKNLIWMDNEGHSDLTFEVPKATGWIKANVDQYGYYRVDYDAENWKKLTDQLNDNHKALTPADRAGLLDDAFSLARSGDVSETLALNMTRYLTKEMDYVPYVTTTANLAYISSQLSYFPRDYKAYKAYMKQQVKPAVDRLGWEDKGTHLEKYLRSTVLAQACHAEDKDAIEGVLKMFKDWKDHGKKIAPNLRSIVYSVGIKKGGMEDWEFMFDRYMKETVASEKKKLLYALTSSEDKDILKRYLEYSLDASKVRPQDSTYVINAVARNHHGHQLAWNFFQLNYKELYSRYGKGSFDFGRMIKAVTGHFNTEEMKNEVKEFFKGRNAGSGTRAVQQSLESIVTNIAWVKKNKEVVVRWLEHNTGSTSPVKGRDE